jgi:hypothetical protein
MSKEKKSLSIPKKVNNIEKFKAPKNTTMNTSLTKLKPTINKRKCLIYDEINDILNNLHLDPILETFKHNEILKEFFLKRIMEILTVYNQ